MGVNWKVGPMKISSILICRGTREKLEKQSRKIWSKAFGLILFLFVEEMLTFCARSILQLLPKVSCSYLRATGFEKKKKKETKQRGKKNTRRIDVLFFNLEWALIRTSRRWQRHPIPQGISSNTPSNMHCAAFLLYP